MAWSIVNKQKYIAILFDEIVVPICKPQIKDRTCHPTPLVPEVLNTKGFECNPMLPQGCGTSCLTNKHWIQLFTPIHIGTQQKTHAIFGLMQLGTMDLFIIKGHGAVSDL